MSRIRRLAGPLCVLGVAASCIWPQPVNEEPQQTPSDVAPSIETPDPGPLVAQPAGNGSCEVSSHTITALSPLGRPLFARFYLNYQNGVQLSNVPIDLTNCRDCGATAPMQSEPQNRWKLAGQTLNLATVQAWLRSGPNTLWVWVSDGFADPCSTPPMPPTPPPDCLPDATDGYYSTSFSWTIDFTQCPNYPP